MSRHVAHIARLLPESPCFFMSNAGYAAGRHYFHAGGGSNHLCLPEEPQWKSHDDTTAALYRLALWYRVPDTHLPLCIVLRSQQRRQ